MECLESGGWWLHLRRCTECGHIGCCDNSPSQHATRDASSSGHPVIRSFEPGEDWFWNYRANEYMEGPAWPPRSIIPLTNPCLDQLGRVPANWGEPLGGVVMAQAEVYLPDVYVRLRERFPEVAEAVDDLGRATSAAGPLDERTQRLVKLGIAMGALAEGAVRSNARRALDAGASKEENPPRCRPHHNDARFPSRHRRLFLGRRGPLS